MMATKGESSSEEDCDCVVCFDDVRTRDGVCEF